MATGGQRRGVADLALTFDDGPDPVGTPAVLDALRRAGVRATFFMVGPRARDSPDLVARVREEGHGIGLHCDEHVRHSERDRDWVARDAERALARLDRLGVAPTLWRTPWGVTAPWTHDVAADLHLRLVGWDADTHDWRGDTAPQMLAATRDRLCGGSIVLAHDGIGPGARRRDCSQTAAYVDLVALHASALQLRCAALS